MARMGECQILHTFGLNSEKKYLEISKNITKPNRW